MLRAYNDIEPGLAREIILMSQKEGDHRRERETKEDDAQIENMRRGYAEARWGQVLGFLFGALAICGGGYTAMHGAEIAGGFIGVGGIGSIVTAFIVGRKSVPSKADPTGEAKQLAELKAGPEKASLP